MNISFYFEVRPCKPSYSRTRHIHSPTLVVPRWLPIWPAPACHIGISWYSQARLFQWEHSPRRPFHIPCCSLWRLSLSPNDTACCIYMSWYSRRYPWWSWLRDPYSHTYTPSPRLPRPSRFSVCSSRHIHTPYHFRFCLSSLPDSRPRRTRTALRHYVYFAFLFSSS
jgi:hypothetical protein